MRTPGHFLTTHYTHVCPLLRYPIVSLGVLRWVEHTLSDLTFFEEAAESSPLFLVLLDEVRESLEELSQYGGKHPSRGLLLSMLGTLAVFL